MLDSRTNYLPAVDGLRFFAFLLVFASHLGSAPATIAPWVEKGWVGVDLFFVISSFLFFHLLSIEERQTGTINVQHFYFRRVLRLYPLMLIYPLIMTLAFPWLTERGITGRMLGLAFFSDNLLSWTRGYNVATPFSTHLWTLSYEFQVYFVIPLVFMLSRAVPLRTFLHMMAAVLVISIGARLAFKTAGTPHPAIWVTPFLRPDAVLAGIAIALLPKVRISVGVVSAILVMALAAILAAPIPDLMHTNLHFIGVYPASAIFACALLWLALNHAPTTRFLSWPVLSFLGRISFGLYVFHLVGTWLAGWFFEGILEHRQPEEWSNYLPRTALALVITIALSIVSYYGFERFFLKAKMKVSAIQSRPI